MLNCSNIKHITNNIILLLWIYKTPFQSINYACWWLTSILMWKELQHSGDFHIELTYADSVRLALQRVWSQPEEQLIIPGMSMNAGETEAPMSGGFGNDFIS